jgi:Tol biopolymer transport system component
MRLATACLLLLVATHAHAQPSPPGTLRWVTAHTDRNPAISPDGRTLVFSSDRSGREALYVRTLPDGPVRVLVDSGDAPGYPAWSPDGRSIAFTADVDGADDLFIVSADGSGRRVLVAHPSRDGHPRFSPDGTRVYFNSERAGSEPGTTPVTAPAGEDRVDIYSVRVDGSDLRRHTDCGSECSYPSVSPDGTRLLYRRVFWQPGDGAPVRNSEVAVANLDGSDERNLLDSPAYDVYPTWSHDGRWIYYASDRDNPRGRIHAWRVPAEGGEAQRLSDGEWSHRQPVPHPDGESVYVFAFRREAGGEIGYIAAITLPP